MKTPEPLGIDHFSAKLSILSGKQRGPGVDTSALISILEYRVKQDIDDAPDRDELVWALQHIRTAKILLDDVARSANQGK